jgi:hypothetical protein
MTTTLKLTVGDPRREAMIAGLSPALAGVVLGLMLVAYFVYLTILALAMAGLHGVRGRFATLAIAVAVLGGGLLAGALRFHWRLRFPLNAIHPVLWPTGGNLGGIYADIWW